MKAVSATWMMATLAVMAKKRHRTFGTAVPLPSGRYRARYFYQGVFHNPPETYRMVADANTWLTVEGAKILQGTWVPVAGSAMTVAELGDKWLASNPLKRDRSRSRDASTVKHYIRPVIGAIKVAGPTKVALQEPGRKLDRPRLPGPLDGPPHGLDPACSLQVRVR